MSDRIYDDVIITESEQMNREQVELIENRELIVDIYECEDSVRDPDFNTETNTQQPLQNTGNDFVKAKKILLVAMVCLVLLCFLVISVYIYTNNTDCTQDTSITKLTKIKDVELGEDCKNQIQTNEKKDQIKQREQSWKETDLQKSIHDLDGWFYYQSGLYFISSETKNWTESRRYCRDRSADLIIINNKQEQDYFMKKSGKSFWIGLTDSDEEGTWKWVDGTNMTTGFWGTFEPNGGKAENCASSYPSGWADYKCYSQFNWICKKSTLKCL